MPGSSIHRHEAYGLAIASELELHEVLPGWARRPADVTIRFGAVPADGLPGGEQLGPFLWTTPTSFWLQVPRVATFLVENGDTIVIDPVPGIDEDSIRVFLLGSALGALLFQRGRLVLHGNAVRIGDACMVCVGPSGAGKSTLAAGFQRRGYPILADDVVAVDEACCALPGFPRLKLWEDVTARLNIDTAPLRRIRPNTLKFNFPLGADFATSPVPIRWVYLLEDDHIDAMAVEPIRGMAKFMPLRRNTYRIRYLDGMALKGRHLALCSRLAGRVRLARVTRPRHGFTLEPMIDCLLQDMRDAGG